jgi:cell division protein FtsB
MTKTRPTMSIGRLDKRGESDCRVPCTMGALALILLVLFLSDVHGDHGFLAMRRTIKQVDRMQRQIQLVNEENRSLAKEVQALKTDTQLIETIARQEMGMVRPGEVIFRLPSEPNLKMQDALSRCHVNSRLDTLDEAIDRVICKWFANEYKDNELSGSAGREVEYPATVSAWREVRGGVPKIEVTSMSAHGSQDILIVQVAVALNGGPPPDGPSRRYLKLMHMVKGGWEVLTETGRVGYYLALFR